MPSDSPASIHIAVIIPARNEEQAILSVLEGLQRALPHLSFVESSALIVVDNGSTDQTASLARDAGAQIVTISSRGYGSACRAGLTAVPAKTDTVVFVEGDHSVYAEDLGALLLPLLNQRADLVLGTRVLVDDGSLTRPQKVARWLACHLLLWFYDYAFQDICPFRAVRRQSLIALGMRESGSGWPLEMQIKAVKQQLTIAEVPVRWRRRLGPPKTTGWVTGSFKAGAEIIAALLKYAS